MKATDFPATAAAAKVTPAAPVCSDPQTCSLDCLKVGCQGNVVCVTGEVEFRRRLLEMGFCNGAAVELVRRAPFGDPIEFRLRGYCLSLRNEQAKHVRVTIGGMQQPERP